jgi:glycosyltransferase involved in cell wall biosynthesis
MTTTAWRIAPKLSVAIPTYSRAAYLAQAVQSVLTQSYSDFELLISDDGSSPDVQAAGEAAAARDRRVRYWRNSENLGLAGNWNRCVDEARGEYILIIGDDDRVAPGGLAALASQALPGDDVVFANHYIIDESGRRSPEETSRFTAQYGREKLRAGAIDDAEAVVWRNSVPICAALVRTLLARKLRFKEELNTPELVLFAELASARATFRFVPAFVSEYRVHAGSMTSSGLRTDALAARLLDITVRPATEPQKRKLLSPILTDGIKRCLLRGDIRSARNLHNSHYFQFVGRTPHSILLRLCLCLPGAGSSIAYKKLRKLLK